MKTPLRPYLIVCLFLLLIQVITIWVVHALPLQDIPQHLANARIFMDYDKNPLFQQYYELPDHFAPYHTLYYLLSALGSWVGLSAAFKLLMSIYCIFMPLSFAYLYKACWPTYELEKWPAILGFTLVWNIATLMGFLQYFIAMPFIFFGLGAFVALQHSKKTMLPNVVFLASIACLVLLHPFAIGLFAFIIIINLGQRKVPLKLFIKAVGGVFVFGLIFLTLAPWLGRIFPTLIEYTRPAYGFEFINDIFGFTWYDPLPKINYIMWAILGAYRPLTLLCNFLVITLFVWKVRKISHNQNFLTGHPLLMTTLLFALIWWFIPWGMQKPDEITFINFRMLPVLLGIALTLVPPQIFENKQARNVLLAITFYMVSLFSVKCFQFNAEAKEVDQLLNNAKPAGVLNALVLHNTSDFFAKQFKVTHFLPTYYIAHHQGIASQFWARYTKHLPVAYKPGAQPKHTADWLPDRFKPSDVEEVDYVLVQWATMSDSQRMRKTSKKIKKASQNWREVACSINWCLYKI